MMYNWYTEGINVRYVSEPYKEGCYPNPGIGLVTDKQIALRLNTFDSTKLWAILDNKKNIRSQHGFYT